MSEFDDLAVARDVLSIEIEGIQSLAGALDEAFVKAVAALATVDGRVIVSGMGKSGHIARKIAATFASTGQPAIFVHPGEASHGDLGMITERDAVLALSKSGETPELRDLLAYAGRFSIPLIAITEGAKSTLATASDIALLLPKAREACAETHAPTTSTSMMIALGDALAVALLRRQGFTATDFHTFHPGGKLGAALRRVSDLMHDSGALPLCAPDATVPEAVEIMSDHGFGCVGVTDATGSLVGIITDGDLRRRMSEKLFTSSAAEVMTENPKVVTPETLAGEALAILSEKKITGLFVVRDGKPVGILHVHDCLASGVI